MTEADFIARVRAIASHSGARGLADDVAVIGDMVLTHDMIVEGVHFLPDDDPADVAWKLVAVNLSDLAAKGADPLGVLVGYGLSDAGWDAGFADGLAAVLNRFAVPLLGGDTVRPPAGAPRSFGMTAIGSASIVGVPSRAGARHGDDLWVTGTIGDAGLGLAMRRGEIDAVEDCLAAYARPLPQLSIGRAVVPYVHAMMDVSDGLLIDAARMAAASGCRAHIMLDCIPLSASLLSVRGDALDARLAAATAGDDYQLLFAADPAHAAAIVAIDSARITRIGRCEAGSGVRLTHGPETIRVPELLGYEH